MWESVLLFKHNVRVELFKHNVRVELFKHNVRVELMKMTFWENFRILQKQTAMSTKLHLFILLVNFERHTLLGWCTWRRKKNYTHETHNNSQFKNSKVDQIEIETLDTGLLMNTFAKHLANCKVNKEVEKMAKLKEMAT
jgi:hypothetical protein